MLAWYLAVNKKVMFLGSFVGIAIRDIYICIIYSLASISTKCTLLSIRIKVIRGNISRKGTFLFFFSLVENTARASLTKAMPCNRANEKIKRIKKSIYIYYIYIYTIHILYIYTQTKRWEINMMIIYKCVWKFLISSGSIYYEKKNINVLNNKYTFDKIDSNNCCKNDHYVAM